MSSAPDNRPIFDPDTWPSDRRPRRVFPWVFGGVQVLFLIVVIGWLNRASVPDCGDATGQACSGAYDAGWSIGAGAVLIFLLFVWAVVDVILGISYSIFRR